MKKAFFSICLLMPLCLQSMERQFHGGSHRPFDIESLFSDLLQPATKESNNDRVILALTESRMKGSCNAIIDKKNNTLKLEFLDIDPERNKQYVCLLQKANKKITDEIADFKNELEKEGRATNWDYYETLLKKELAINPFANVSDGNLKRVQMGRFMAFITNYDLFEALKEEQSQIKAGDFIEIQNSKKLKLEKLATQAKQIMSNRLAFQLELVGDNSYSINAARNKELHITPYVSLLEYITNLRRAAVNK